jgi:YHS domain-containing protein
MATSQDPVCGLIIEVDRSVARSARGSVVYVFCSVECQDRFHAEPERYAAIPTGAEHLPLERHEPPFTTVGGVTVPKFGSAGSGGLEYEKVPERHSDK